MREQVNKTLVFRRNILVAAGVIVVLVLLSLVPRYHQVILGADYSRDEIDRYETRTLNKNLPKLTLDDKRFLSIGNYWYLKYLRESTPDSAVILLPPHSVVDTSKEMKDLAEPDWVEYFIYPRLCVSEDEKNTKKELYEKANYVAIVRGWGYDKLHYQPAKHESEAVLPVDEIKK